MSNNSNALAATTFNGYVRGLEGQQATPGDLLCFVNGTHRPSAMSEAHNLKDLPRPRTSTLWRIMTGQGKGSGGDQAGHSPSVLVTDRGFVDLLYKVVPDNEYVDGGVHEAGQYMGQQGAMGSNKVPSDYQNPQGWTPMAGQNGYRVSIR